MSARALLVGAADYGAGFVPLPAVRHDLELMRDALVSRGFSVRIADPASVANASVLDGMMRRFCRDAGTDLSIIYFSGHGMSMDGRDWIIPANVSRAEATESSNQRVATDLSRTVAIRSAGPVLFIIDACRDASDDSTAKSGQGWANGLIEHPNSRFIRMFGCSTGQTCHVLRKGRDGNDVSVFTTALVRALTSTARIHTLKELLAATERECEEIAAKSNPSLPVQKPCFAISSDMSQAVLEWLEAPILQSAGTQTAGADGRVWQNFEHQRLHCVVVESEHSSYYAASLQPLHAKVSDAFAGAGENIWEVFYELWNGCSLVNGSVRSVPKAFDRSEILIAALAVEAAFVSKAALEETIGAVIQADLAFFDLTRFEPGVMFLLGVRAATRRGVTICSHGFGWREGQQLETPFNLNDLQIFSHTDNDSPGDDPAVSRLIAAILQGFRQLRRRPRYQDLPAYDSLRELGSEAQASGTIPWQDLVLALCSFRPEHRELWRYVRRELERGLQGRGVAKPQVRRLIDLGSCQLVSQSLYEHIRRVAACVMDWSLFSPSSFLELGVRLAVSPWGVSQIIEERYLPGVGQAPRIRGPKGEIGPELRQLELMRKLFQPMSYRTEAKQSLAALVDDLIDRQPFDHGVGKSSEHGWIHLKVRQAVAPVTTIYPLVYEELRRTADSLNSTDQQRTEAPQVLFSASNDVKRDRERAALECRIAAWLYLEHRINAGSLPTDDSLRKLHRDLGQRAAASLYDSDASADQLLADLISGALGAEAK